MTSHHRDSSTSSQVSKVHFPDYPNNPRYSEDAVKENEAHLSPKEFTFPSQQANGAPKQQKWQARMKDRVSFALPGGSERRARQKSLSEAWHTIRQRRGSVTDNAREIGEALKAPVSPALVVRLEIPPLKYPSTSNTPLASLRRLVHDFHLLQRLVQINSHRLSIPSHAYCRSIRIRFFMVYYIFYDSTAIP